VSPFRAQPFVLVADDDRDTRELYRACFDTNGCRTAEAPTGSQAIAAAIEIVPDVLLTDYLLPDVDGITVARRLKRDVRTAGIRILMVTGYPHRDLEIGAKAAGIERVMFKPCLPQAVLREVSRAIARRGMSASQAADPRPPVVRVREEFAALPGLTLTAEQIRLVADLDVDGCTHALNTLLAEGFLARTGRGGFVRPM
jgi:two-component system, cell cycle response regulator DivK